MPPTRKMKPLEDEQTPKPLEDEQTPKRPVRVSQVKPPKWKCLSEFSGWFEGTKYVNFVAGEVYEGPEVEYAAERQPSWFEKA